MSASREYTSQVKKLEIKIVSMFFKCATRRKKNIRLALPKLLRTSPDVVTRGDDLHVLAHVDGHATLSLSLSLSLSRSLSRLVLSTMSAQPFGYANSGELSAAGKEMLLHGCMSHASPSSWNTSD